MKNKIKKFLRRLGQKILFKIFPQVQILSSPEYSWSMIQSSKINLICHAYSKLYPPYHISNSKIGKYTYIAQNAYIFNTSIGAFCSIGTNLVCGWGMHPTKGISTHPMFFSTKKQNGLTLSQTDKIDELEPITIGNDVFIGANVTILNGVTIGDGAVIGAGAVVSKDIPPYAIAVGCPIQIKKYRFNDEIICSLKKIQWWNFSDEELLQVEKYFFEVDKFIANDWH